MSRLMLHPCGCCTPSQPNVTSYRLRGASASQFGFPPLFSAPVAGRYIAPGWAGLAPGTPAMDREALEDLEWPDPRYHEEGDIVAFRSGADGATVQYYKLPPGTALTDIVPPNAPWQLMEVAAPPAVVDTYIQTGYWRGNVKDFFQGELVYLCVPDSQETSDDWHVQLFHCNNDVENAGRPDLDTNFTPVFTGGGLNPAEALELPNLYGQMPARRLLAAQFPAFNVVVDQPVVSGAIITVGGIYYQTHQAFGFGETLLLDHCSRFNETRAFAPAELRVVNACIGTSVRRFLQLSFSAELSGGMTGSAEGGITMDPATGIITGQYPAMDAGTVASGIVDNGDGTRTQTIGRSGRCAYPFFPDAAAQFDPGNFQEKLTMVKAYRLKSVTLGADSNSFEWEMLLVSHTENILRADGARLSLEEHFTKVSLTQSISVSQENTEAAVLASMSLAPQLGGMGSQMTAGVSPVTFFNGCNYIKQVTDQVFLRGPQTARLDRFNCDGSRTCQNIQVPAGGQAFPFPNVTSFGAATRLLENRTC